jgi:hypothetical protein
LQNFNLIAIKESLSVERLTRVTLLLGKVTVLFMPVSLMTGYFSCQFKDIQFVASTYWAWFGGLLGVSILSLFMFSLMSSLDHDDIVYRSLGKRFVDFSSRLVTNKPIESDIDAQMYTGHMHI